MHASFKNSIADSIERFGKFVMRNFTINPEKKRSEGHKHPAVFSQFQTTNSFLFLSAVSAPQTQLTPSFVFHLFILGEVLFERVRGSEPPARQRRSPSPEVPSSQPPVSAAQGTVFAGNHSAFLISGPAEYLCTCLPVDPHYQLQQQV